MKRQVVFVLIFLLGAMTTACNPADSTAHDAETSAPGEPTIRRTAVEVAEVETGSISQVFSYSGNLTAKKTVDVVPRVAGEVEQLNVEIGDAVKAGEIIAEIDDELYLLDLKQAESALSAAQLELEKMEGGARPEEISAAQSALNISARALDDAVNIDSDERTTAAANMAAAQADLRRAQAEYDKIAWAGQVGATPQAAALEQATVAYEAALAAYNLQTNPSDKDLAPLQGQLVEAQLNLALAEAPFRPVDFEIVHSKIAQAEVGVEKAELQVDYTTVYAPFDGFVTEVDVEAGSMVGQGNRIANLVSKELEVVVAVEESRLGQIFEGQNAAIQVAAFPGEIFPALVTAIPPVADGTTHTFDVIVTPEDESGLLRAGMFADVRILVDERDDATLVPGSAVVLIDGQPTVYVITEAGGEKIASLRPVQLGLRTADVIEITSGVEPGEIAVTVGQSNLIDGVPVTLFK